MLAVLKNVYGEIIATTAEMVSSIKVLIVHINTLCSWLSVIGNVRARLASVLSVMYTQNEACSLITKTLTVLILTN